MVTNIRVIGGINMKDKIAHVLQTLFGYGIVISLFVGGLSFFGYLVAIIIGGDTATQICTIIYKNIYPYLVKISTISVLLGLIHI